MTRDQQILDALRTSGERMTVARRAVVRLFASATSPLTAIDILTALKKSHTAINKTTIYRELKFLESKHIIRALQFDERNRRYELIPNDHRHHLICTSCKKIDDVVLDHDLDEVEQKVATSKGFTVKRHALEFYGVCGDCRP